MIQKFLSRINIFIFTYLKLPESQIQDEDDTQNNPEINGEEGTNNINSLQIKPPKIFSCQMCKKQFEQRLDLQRHQCIEQTLKLLRKKKEIRKKKWREAHWKRKIDLSYIESTSLTQLSKNIADNLSFCIDGTQEDLRAFSREVKDYMNSEIGDETELEMLIRCCFVDYASQFTSIPNAQENFHNFNDSFIDFNVLKRAQNYFVNHSNSSIADLKFSCKTCKGIKFSKLIDLIQHHRNVHNLDLKTTFDQFMLTQQQNDTSSKNSTNNTTPNGLTPINISPIGYLQCDPTSYLLNLFWDKEVCFFMSFFI